MRVSVSWLAEHLGGELPSDPESIAEAFVRVGLEVEAVHAPPEITGPLVIGRVLEIEELTEFKKPIRFVRVDDGAAEPRGVICGATNFAVGDLVVVARPGATLPGDFAITARHVLRPDLRRDDLLAARARSRRRAHRHPGAARGGRGQPGDDARPLLGLDDPIFELAITPDRGYCFSVRGLARELGGALDLPFTDPALSLDIPPADGEAWPVKIEDAVGCRRFVARRVTGVDPTRPSPWWMQRRLLAAGQRPISLAVDVTNYVMLRARAAAARVRRRETGRRDRGPARGGRRRAAGHPGRRRAARSTRTTC